MSTLEKSCLGFEYSVNSVLQSILRYCVGIYPIYMYTDLCWSLTHRTPDATGNMSRKLIWKLC